MPADMQKLNRTKELILTFIRARGPSLPVHIARDVNVSPLFASAYLSEIYNEGKLKMSHTKVGSSPLYYLPDQVSQLENFTSYLNIREKEAFNLIKKERIIKDEDLLPVMRVAIREIKDFAIPFEINVNKEKKVFWKYFLLSDAELKKIYQDNFLSKKKKEAEEEIKIENEEKKSEDKENKLENEDEEKKERLKVREKKQKLQESAFTKKIKDYLTEKNIEILNIIEEKKKDLVVKVRVDTMFGKQEYICFAKDKKKLSDLDLAIAVQKSQSEKIPSLILSPGEIDKKSLEVFQEWRHLIKFEKIKF